MKVVFHAIVMSLSIMASACNSTPTVQPTLPPTMPPTAVPIAVPTTATYEYDYELVNTRLACEPDYETWRELLSLSLDSLDNEDADNAAAKAAAIIRCTQSQLQTQMRQRGSDGWKLIAFEALPPVEYDLGIEYSFRLVWERNK